jgi:hypothetical protein
MRTRLYLRCEGMRERKEIRGWVTYYRGVNIFYFTC